MGVAAEIISAAWIFLELATLKCGMFPIAPQTSFEREGNSGNCAVRAPADGPSHCIIYCPGGFLNGMPNCHDQIPAVASNAGGGGGGGGVPILA